MDAREYYSGFLVLFFLTPSVSMLLQCWMEREMNKLRGILFYPEYHESAGGLRLWAASVLMVGVLLATGYLEGLEQAGFQGIKRQNKT